VIWTGSWAVADFQTQVINEEVLIHGQWMVVQLSFLATTHRCWLVLPHILVPCRRLLLAFIMQENHRWFVTVT